MNFVIPESELRIRVSRSGGPGGQHANKTSTRVEVSWNVRESLSITDAQRDLILERLASRIDLAGWLSTAASTSRSQLSNRQDATLRLSSLVTNALKPRKRRKATRVPRGAKEERLAAKKHRAQLKANRQVVAPDD